MARYYEESALLEFVKKYTPTIGGETTMECVERAIRNSPTADVVPRAMIAEIFGEIEEGLEYEIDLEDKRGKNAWAQGDVSGFQTHEYAEDKLDTLLIALSLLKKKYTEGG